MRRGKGRSVYAPPEHRSSRAGGRPDPEEAMVDEEPPEADEDEDEDADFDGDEPDLDDDLEDVIVIDDDDVDVDVLADDDEEEEDDDDDVPAPKRAASDDDDDEDIDPSDVEADLEEILRDRIAANDDEDDDEDEGPIQDPAKKVSVAPKRSDEWTCPQCFLIVSSSQFGTKEDPRCPSGEDPCASLKRALG